MRGDSGDTDILIVVPTLGRRVAFFRRALESIRRQSVACDIVVVAPRDADSARSIAQEFGAHVIDDPGALPAAINLGIQRSLRGHRFVSWLGDDDLLEPGSFEAVVDLLEKSPEASAGFGACRYIDEEDRDLWVSRVGRWAPVILAWGPDLIPQPGMLIRSGAWRSVGGLDCSYELAFDLDLLLRLKRVGALVSTRTVVSSFRWHGDSLTVDDRDRNLRESERAKRAALGPIARNVAWLWELPVRVATLLAVKRMNARASQRGTY